MSSERSKPARRATIVWLAACAFIVFRLATGAAKQSTASAEVLNVRSGGLILRAQVWHPSGSGRYPPFGADSRAGHNLIFGAVSVWESDTFAFLDRYLRK
jgi:hypothetical protein